MNVIIPMAGKSLRFKKDGYKLPKYLISLNGIPVIKHIINLYPKKTNFYFILNDHDSKNTNALKVIKNLSQNSNIYSIDNHSLGPVYTVSKIFNELPDKEPVIVNYCDFSLDWSYLKFSKYVRYTKCDSCIITYKGFHPHMLRDTNFGYCKTNQEGKILSIREKNSFTKNRMNEHASAGLYYFRNAKTLKEFGLKLIKSNSKINGEFYISMIHELMRKNKYNNYVFEIEKMLQWGHPEDLKEYLQWSVLFNKLIKYKNNLVLNNCTTILPMAGRGQRFSSKGYKVPKPFLLINKKEMYKQALKCLPETNKKIIVTLNKKNFLDKLKIKNCNKVLLKKVLPGQACTVEYAIKNQSIKGSILIGSCDNGIIYDKKDFKNLVDLKTDVIVFTFNNNYSVSRNPKMYSWVETDKNNNILKVNVKNFNSKLNPFESKAIVGAFYFRDAEIYMNSINNLYKSKIRTNNEFYIDNLINESIKLNYKVKSFLVENYICWGTPNDFETYNYWQDFFSKAKFHQYKKQDSHFL